MTTWIFLRGLTRESRHWGRFLEQFRQVLPEHLLVAPGIDPLLVDLFSDAQTNGGLLLAGETWEKTNVYWLARLDPKGNLIWEKTIGYSHTGAWRLRIAHDVWRKTPG